MAMSHVDERVRKSLSSRRWRKRVTLGSLHTKLGKRQYSISGAVRKEVNKHHTEKFFPILGMFAFYWEVSRKHPTEDWNEVVEYSEVVVDRDGLKALVRQHGLPEITDADIDFVDNNRGP